MSEPTLSACAALVRRNDPVLFRTALFASEPARERLLTLYAFDIELSRATRRTAEPLIAAMRLRFWHDAVVEAGAGGPVRAHEVAAPLCDLIKEQAFTIDSLVPLIEAREMELDAPLDAERFSTWADARYGRLTELALRTVAPESDPGPVAAPAGQALARAFALRSAAAMAAGGGVPLLPDLAPSDRAELAAGRMTPDLIRLARELASDGMQAVKDARARRKMVPRAALPALLPLGDAAKILRRVLVSGADLPSLAQAPRLQAPEMLWRALAGRW